MLFFVLLRMEQSGMIKWKKRSGPESLARVSADKKYKGGYQHV
jgi:hypothetical protein